MAHQQEDSLTGQQALAFSDGGFETWDAGGANLFLYTEHKEFARTLRTEFGRGTRYSYGAREFAWQFLIPKRMLDFLKARYRKMIRAEGQEDGKRPVHNQQLTDAPQREFARGGTNLSRAESNP